MGCGQSKGAGAFTPSDDEASRQGQRATQPAPTGTGGKTATTAYPPTVPDSAKAEDAAAEMGWVHSSPPSGSEGRVVLPTRSTGAVRVQVMLDSWTDMGAAEVATIMEHFNKDEKQFRIMARGQAYTVDLNGWKQTNCSTGKERPIRIVEADSPEEGWDFKDEKSEKLRTPSSKEGPPEDTITTEVTKDALDPEVLQQMEYGPQSRRGGASQAPLVHLEGDPHALQVFVDMATNEKKLCGEWAVFYHSYSYAALLYEVNAAVGAVLFRFRSQYSPLPRLLVHEFHDFPDADALVRRFNDVFAKNGKRDHDPAYRTVAVSVMCSLVSTGPEASPSVVFREGYSCKDLSFRKVLNNLLESCYVPKSKVTSVGDNVILLAEKHGLDVSQFGGKACRSGKPGHLLQIFIRRPLVDTLVYAAKPYGFVDEDRMPISTWMDGNRSFSFGQARILCHPRYFLKANWVRQFVASSDPTFHANRKAFQQELTRDLKMILSEPSLREKAAKGIYGGSLPSWWTSEDQRAKGGQ